MDAVICTDFNTSEIRSIPRPQPDDEVVIAVERVQLSVTECELFQGNDVIHIEDIQERLTNGDGRLFGHEFSGEIVEMGTAVESFDIGDRVYAPGKIPCRNCSYCWAGHPNLCADEMSIGYDRPGALAEYVKAPVEPLSRLPETVSPAEGAAMQPLHNSMIAVCDADIRTGETVVIIGAGVMGYQCGQFALRNGAGKVIAVDIVPEKLDHAREKGMLAIDANMTDPVKEVRDITDGIGADVVFEAVGGPHDHGTTGDDPLAQSFQMVRNGGRIVQIGHISGDVSLRPRSFRSKSVDWINPVGWTFSIGPNATTGEIAPQFVADGRVSIEEFVTHELDGLDEFERAVEITSNKSDYDALGPAQIVITR